MSSSSSDDLIIRVPNVSHAESIFLSEEMARRGAGDPGALFMMLLREAKAAQQDGEG